MRVDSPRASTLCNPSLSAASMSSWASQAQAFHQPVCQRLSTAPLECSTCPYHRSLLSFRMRSRSSMPSRTSSSLDLVVTMSCGLTLQISLIIALSFRCRRWRFGFVNGQVSLTWRIALRTQELYIRPRVLKERWREERTSSGRFSHVLWLKVHSHLLLRACLLGSIRTLPTQAGLPSVDRVFCQALEPTAFLVHPVLAAIAEDVVAAHSSATDGAWKLA